MSGLRINISKLAEGIHHRSMEATPEDVGLDERFSRTFSVQATLEKTSKQLFLRVDIATVGAFTCDRCLDEYVREVKAKYGVVYLFGADDADGTGGHEVQFIAPESGFVEIGEDVRQFTTLAVPQKLLCADDCRGLCPRCGVNRNRETCSCAVEELDPRWSELGRFLEN